jgi:uncharacterized protein (TIGR02271 family)
MAPEVTDAYEWRGRTLIGGDNEKIGEIDEIYLNVDSGEPEWATVKTGLFGSKTNFVPIDAAWPKSGAVHVEATKDQVKDAPSIDPDGELSAEEEQRLYGHYGREYSEPAAQSSRDQVGEDTSGPTTDDAMTRSEEELAVGTTTRERGRARLRKYVVTEQVETTVPVQREEVRIEREPITDANVDRATDGPEISEEEHEVVLNEEEVVVEKKAVPKERVRMSKDTVTDEATVSEEVRKEQIEAEGDR